MKFILFFVLLSMAKCIDILDDLLTNLHSNAHFDDLIDFALDDAWDSYKDRYGKNYGSQEDDSFRKKNFQRNLKRASEHNAKQSNYTLGVNKYSDLSPEEARKQLMGYKGYNNHTSTASPYPKAPQATLPAPTVDWRTKGYVTPVKDQGSCGSCYSFSATGALEGQVKRKTGKLANLSEQNLIDCSTSQGNGGCDGGWMIQAFKYVQMNKGIDTEKAYPYIEDEGLTCAYTKIGRGANCTGYVEVPTGDEKALMKTVEQIGPVSVAVNADDDFISYKDGIYDKSPCNNTIDDLTHAVLVVGYGTENGKDYWLVKNSWGTTWGIDGYIKMVRNKNNTCGIATKASYPLVV